MASGAPVTSGSAVTLTAAVVSGSQKVTSGQVNFCDASVTYCTDIHLLGTAQLTSAGTATIILTPAIGAHSYKAAFAGTPNGTAAYAASSSGATSLTVTGLYPAITSIAQSPGSGGINVTATVGGNAAMA